MVSVYTINIPGSYDQRQRTEAPAPSALSNGTKSKENSSAGITPERGKKNVGTNTDFSRVKALAKDSGLNFNRISENTIDGTNIIRTTTKSATENKVRTIEENIGEDKKSGVVRLEEFSEEKNNAAIDALKHLEVSKAKRSERGSQLDVLI